MKKIGISVKTLAHMIEFSRNPPADMIEMAGGGCELRVACCELWVRGGVGHKKAQNGRKNWVEKRGSEIETFKKIQLS